MKSISHLTIRKTLSVLRNCLMLGFLVNIAIYTS